jgi:hypothetical protein
MTTDAVFPISFSRTAVQYITSELPGISGDPNPAVVGEEAHDAAPVGLVHAAGETDFDRHALLTLQVVLKQKLHKFN